MNTITCGCGHTPRGNLGIAVRPSLAPAASVVDRRSSRPLALTAPLRSAVPSQGDGQRNALRGHGVGGLSGSSHARVPGALPVSSSRETKKAGFNAVFSAKCLPGLGFPGIMRGSLRPDRFHTAGGQARDAARQCSDTQTHPVSQGDRLDRFVEPGRHRGRRLPGYGRPPQIARSVARSYR